jgi:DNA-binding SARP family transcriptional activator/predicted ATPase
VRPPPDIESRDASADVRSFRDRQRPSLGGLGLTVDFRILGPLEVCVGDVTVAITAPRQRTVLAILLVRVNRVVSLDQLVDHLYGDRPPAQAVGSVQAYVSHLRRLLEPDRARRDAPRVLVSRAPGYVLVVDPADIDASRFESTLAKAQAALAQGRPAAAAADIDAALAQWRGPALAEFAYEPFAHAEAARLEELHTAALECRIDAHLALGRETVVVAEAEHHVAEHPLREHAWAALILSLYRSGRQGDALRAFQQCRTVLAEELGVDPGPQLRQLEADVLAHSPALDWRPPAAEHGASTTAGARVPSDVATDATRDPDSDPPHLGREDEIARLAAALARARKGRGGLALVGGEPGIGKTALVQAFGRRSLRVGEHMVWGTGHEGQGAPAFWMWGQVVRSLAEATGHRFDEMLAQAGIPRSRLSALVPEWSQPAGAAGPPGGPAEARFQLYQDATAVLAAVSSKSAVVVVLDDLQWADVASLELLEFAAPHLRRAPVLLVGTYRDNEVIDGHPLAATLGALARLPDSLRLFPRPLTRRDVAAYLGAVTGDALDDDVAEVIRARTGGNPFFLTELVKLLGSEQSLGRPLAARDSPVPVGVRDVVRRRLSRLPEQTNALLSVAAVIGPEFDIDTLEAVSVLDAEAAEEALDLALVSGVVVDDAHAAHYRFSHALVRETVYTGMSRRRRARLHARVATVLEATPSADPAALAHHCFEAVPIVAVDRAVAATLRAAEAAQGALAFEQAEDLLGRALEMLAATPDGERGPEGTARQELGVQRRLMGLLTMTKGYAHPGVEAAAQRMLDLCRLAGDADDEILAALAGLGAFHVVRGDFDAAAAVVQMKLAAAEAAGAPPLLVGGHLDAGIVAMHRGQLQLAHDHFVPGIVAADSLLAHGAVAPEIYPQDPAMTGRAFLAIIAAMCGDGPGAAEEMRLALTRARATGHPYNEVWAMFFDAWLAVLLGDPAAAQERAGDTAARASQTGFGLFVAMAQVLQGWARARQDHDEEPVRILDEGLSRVRATGARMMVPFFLGLLADAQMAAARHDDARDAIGQAFEVMESTAERFYQAELHRLNGELLGAGSGTGADAVAELRRAIVVARQQGAVLFERRAEASLAALGCGNAAT